MAVFNDIWSVVKIDKIKIPCLTIGNNDCEDQKQTDQQFKLIIRDIVFFLHVSLLWKFQLPGKILDDIIFIFARRNVKAVIKHPKPYLMLRNRLIDDASVKYFVGQLTSAIV